MCACVEERGRSVGDRLVDDTGRGQWDLAEEWVEASRRKALHAEKAKKENKGKRKRIYCIAGVAFGKFMML